MKTHHLVIFIAILLGSISAYGQDDRARFVPPHEVVWLNDSESPEVVYLALQRDPLKNFERGQFVTLPTWGLHPLQSPLIKSSYQQAAELGWRSWAITPPDTLIEPSSLANYNTDVGYYQPDASALDPYRSSLFKRLDAIYEKINPRPGFTVWVIEGISGALWLDWVKENPEVAPDAVVLIDVFLPQLRLNELLSTQIAKLPFPVLDIKSASANRWVTTQWPMHKTMSDKYQQLSYRPRVLLTQPPEVADELHSVIKGWLKFQGF
ncbi:uncharacterized protein DUF3530 [Idiomarina fontislapidosi]|uniref:DUF3530 domain-containing protein n=1 Tax=Idiomarina fontislapidosi TaxID=263723 RepID=A0A432Y8A0_9GAMM|nr:DUF3530 family protein [Idiomarina fontislapidosi]PYE33763.1 uncharacterized protein DUF3530 [Idiomarina fontislapidosi]RUO57162.1 hypothetical protein CWE25_05680 [Idiomarina fontislapidosi]|tara:strand:- start:922 stop:1716 length:795 start_codon:yes stop_codon:yes gene_type:complete